jgi:hypothetical protein
MYIHTQNTKYQYDVIKFVTAHKHETMTTGGKNENIIKQYIENIINTKIIIYVYSKQDNINTKNIITVLIIQQIRMQAYI